MRVRLSDVRGAAQRQAQRAAQELNPLPLNPLPEIHCHTCGGFITDPATVSHRLPDATVAVAAPHTGLCGCAPAIVYGPPAGRMSWPALPKAVIPASRT